MRVCIFYYVFGSKNSRLEFLYLIMFTLKNTQSIHKYKMFFMNQMYVDKF